jgi:putative iron-only hydrogenase system regulator
MIMDKIPADANSRRLRFSRTPKHHREGSSMETRVAVMSIIVENSEAVECINSLLHEYGEYIIGRMGLPYPKRGVQIISVAVDAPVNVINTLSGKIGRLEGITSKTVYSGVVSAE